MTDNNFIDFGISIYTGLEQSLEDNLSSISLASKLGAKYLFTSLHIPEANDGAMRAELCNVMGAAHANGLTVIGDVTPDTIDDNHFIDIARLDDGFTCPDIASLCASASFRRISINASSVNEDLLRELKSCGADFSRIIAVHNFYPRENTGLDDDFFIAQNSLLSRYGIKIGAFIPSMSHPRGPLRCGLPTLESHRHQSVDCCARLMAALGIDLVIIGDPMPSEDEIKSLSKVEKDTVIIKATLLTKSEPIKKLLAHTFTSRPDTARDVTRASESRLIVRNERIDIPPENTIERKRGAITLDNNNYPRYTGELEIIKNPLKSDERVNVVAEIPEDEMSMIDLIEPRKRFKFIRC